VVGARLRSVVDRADRHLGGCRVAAIVADLSDGLLKDRVTPAA
jgi:hypothetical protein